MKTKFIALAILMSLLFLWSCGPTYPDDNTDTSYPVPEIGDATLNYNTNRQMLHCEVSINYDSVITDLRADLDLVGFTIANLQTTLNDSGLLGDAIAGDKVFSRNIALDHIDSLDGQVIAQYDIYESGVSIKSFTDSLDVIANLPPVITEITMPDTIVRPETGSKALLFSVTVDDPNGAYDVTNAFFQVLSNTTGQWSSDFDMYDNGEEGDELAGDGIFSRGLQISSTNTAATNYFRFRVKDTAANFSAWSLDSVVVR